MNITRETLQPAVGFAKFFLLILAISAGLLIGLSLVLTPHWAAAGQLMGTGIVGLGIIFTPLWRRYFYYPIGDKGVSQMTLMLIVYGTVLSFGVISTSLISFSLGLVIPEHWALFIGLVWLLSCSTWFIFSRHYQSVREIMSKPR